MKLCHAQVLALVLGGACTPTSAPAPPTPGDVNLCVWPRGCYLADGSCRRVLSPGDMGVSDLGYGPIVQQVPGDLIGADLAGTVQQGPVPTDYGLVCPTSVTITGSSVAVTCALQDDACPALGPACSGGCARSGQAVAGQACMVPTAAPIHSAFGERCRFPDDVCCQIVDAGTGDGGPPGDAAPPDM